ncbi:hypothetical protein PO909_004750 [Leuciscus waleckii]
MDVLSEAKSKPLSSLSVFSFIPARRTEPKEMRYFNCSPKAPERSLYDCLHQSTEGYDNKLHRDDRTHAKSRGLDIFSEETSRPVPVLSSSEYGQYSPLQSDSGGALLVLLTFVLISTTRMESPGLWRKAMDL